MLWHRSSRRAGLIYQSANNQSTDFLNNFRRGARAVTKAEHAGGENARGGTSGLPRVPSGTRTIRGSNARFSRDAGDGRRKKEIERVAICSGPVDTARQFMVRERWWTSARRFSAYLLARCLASRLPEKAALRALLRVQKFMRAVSRRSSCDPSIPASAITPEIRLAERNRERARESVNRDLPVSAVMPHRCARVSRIPEIRVSRSR